MKRIDPQHLQQPVKIHVCRDKTLTARNPGEPVFNGRALPVFSVRDMSEATNLIILVSRVQYEEHPLLPNQPWFKITLDGARDFLRELELSDLPAVQKKLLAAYERMKLVSAEKESGKDSA